MIYIFRNIRLYKGENILESINVSVIDVTYNSDLDQLKRTLKSVICQKKVSFEIIVSDVNKRVDQVPGDISAQQRHHAVEHRHEKHHKKHPRPGFPDKSVNIKQTREKPAEYFFKVSRGIFKIFRFGRFFSFLPQRRHVHGRSLYIYF